MNWPVIGGYRLTRLRAFIIALAVLDVILFAANNSGWLGITAVLVLCGAGVLFQRLRTMLLWKLRNRLLVTYLFIGVVPITLILALFLATGWLLTAQFAGYLVGSAIERREASLETPVRRLARELPSDRLAIVRQLTASGAPRFEALVTGSDTFRYPADATIEMPPVEWKDYTGVVAKGGQRYLMSLSSSAGNRALLVMPLTTEVLGNLVPGLGSVDFGSVAGRVPPQYNVLDFPVTGARSIPVADWSHANSMTPEFMVVTTRLSAVLHVIFPAVEDATTVLWQVAFYATLILVGIAELLSWYIGVSMTRTLTGAVHNLYEGTTIIGEGNFAHRIAVPKGRDQLAELGRSFNRMGEHLEQFAAVTKEKERLQSEMSIASEVQNRLFPLRPPAAKTLEMLGVCHAALSASGDYFDYFTAADGELVIALGDVAGKGISAALLMASIQSIMRTQLSDGGAAIAPANCVARLNRLLYASTSPEKYATFFFGLYNEELRRLTYTNAGHLQPLLIRGDSWELLEVTGSVVGAFPSLKYEELCIPFGPGDLLIAYTDGITEPENAYGEDFGATRLAEVALRHRDARPEVIVEKVLEAVRQWDTSEEQADDMTLMIVRGLA